MKTQLGKRRTIIAEAKEVEKILAAAEESLTTGRRVDTRSR